MTLRASAIPSEHDHRRHQAMIRCVQQWTTRTRATQQRLVQAIEDFWQRRGESSYKCDHTLLSRILNPVHPHVPTARRPKAMRILQAAMVVCANTEDPNLIAPATDEDNSWAGDDEQSFKVHRARLRHLRENGRDSLFQALHRMGEFFAVARTMDDREPSNELGETLRQRACENVLMALGVVVDAGAAVTDLQERLAGEGVAADIAQRLAQQQIERIDRVLESINPPSVNMLAYGGAALFHCGQQERGMRLLMQAVERCEDISRRHDPHWQTLIELLDRLLEGGHADARRWSRQAAQIVVGFLNQREACVNQLKLFKQSWEAVHAPRVAEHWADAAPQAIAYVHGPDASANDQAVARPRRKARPLSAPAWLMALVLTAGSAIAATPRAAESESRAVTPPPVQYAIRGREARNPPPPPPPPSPARRFTPIGYRLTH